MMTSLCRSHIILYIGAVFASSEIIYVEQNKTVVLCCNDSSPVWLGPPNLTIYSAGQEINSQLPHFSRLSLERTQTLQPHINLKIVLFSTEDEGIYRCMDKTSTDSYFDLRIPVNPSNMTIDGENETHFLNGIEFVPLNIICKVVSGDPVEEISLTKENVTLNKSSNGIVEYFVLPFRTDHMKNVTCTAMVNQTSFMLHRTVQIFLKLRPVISIIPGSTITVVENAKLDINCTFTSNNPTKQIKWTYYSSDGTKTVLSNNTVLNFFNIKRHDAGTYTCMVENMVGVDKGSVILNVQYIDFVLLDTGSGKVLRCIPVVLKDHYTFLSWEHKTEYGDHLRYIQNNGSGDLFFANGYRHTNWIFQNGVYVCSVSVDDSEVMSSEYILEQPGPPFIVLSNRNIQFGSLGSIATLIVNFITFSFETTVVLRNNLSEVVDDYHQSIEENVKIQEFVFDKNVTLRGSRIYIHIPIKSMIDFQWYNIEVTNQFGSSSLAVYLQQFEFTDKPHDTSDIATYTVFPIALFGTTVVAIVVYLIMKRRQQQENSTISNSSPDNQTEHRVQYKEIDSAFYVSVHNNQPHASAPQIQLNLQTGNVAFNRETVSPELARMSLSELIDSVSIIHSDQSEESSEISYLNPSKPYTELQYQTNDTHTLHQYEKVNQWTPNKICRCDVPSALACYTKHHKKTN